MSALCLAAWIIAALKSAYFLPMSLPLKRKNGPKLHCPKLPVLAKVFARNPVHEQEMARVAEEASGLPASMGWPQSVRPPQFSKALPRPTTMRLSAICITPFWIPWKIRPLLPAIRKNAPAQGRWRRDKLWGIPQKSGAVDFIRPIGQRHGRAFAQWPDGGSGCCLLLDMGGTTTDIAIAVDGSPVLERQGMMLGRQAHPWRFGPWPSKSIAVGVIPLASGKWR